MRRTWTRLAFSIPFSALLYGGAEPRAEEPLKGDVSKYTFDKSKVFPGTVRDYWVYVPKGNDLVVRHDGSLYVTNPGAGSEPSRVWYISPKGEARVVDTGLKYSNGVTLSPDQSLLYVAESRTHWVYSYRVGPDGSLEFKQKYDHLHAPDAADDAGADGLRTDRGGRLYVATRLGVQVCDQAGRVNAIIPTPNGKVSNLCFGGEAFDTLFATCGDKVFKRKLKVKGANAFDPPIKPPAPRL